MICRARLEDLGGWPKGLENPMPENFKGIAAMFYAYHAVSPHPSMRNLLNVGPLQQLPDNSIQQFQQTFALLLRGSPAKLAFPKLCLTWDIHGTVHTYILYYMACPEFWSLTVLHTFTLM